ncbi:MAG: site-specific DNA-methyltransferase [Firmicutes bacterium]|jgi:site-specific DNA-methyltransferase (adenine-specific)|nr:site-specific DNA-methyltransferase [Bacillota bacterium]MCL5066565.1 site-specific DNA-methyltransferase [Bacillota bacterium]
MPFVAKTPILRILEGSVVDVIKDLPKGETFQLIYCDPPFYSRKTRILDEAEFDDRWLSLDSYLTAMEKYVAAMADRVSEKGFFALHCDYHASHYLKVMGDRRFGYENFRNEIVWHYKGRRQPAISRLNSKHDVILVWGKSSRSRMNALADPLDRDTYVEMKHQPVQVDEDGREWIWGHMGKGRPRAYRIYLDEVVRRGLPMDDVWEIPIINLTARERVGYPTQKPMKLLTRVVELLSDPGDMLADFMAGSGTLGDVALNLGRKVVLADRNPEAIRIIKQRLAYHQEAIQATSNTGPWT